MRLSWHNYRYYPYERDLAAREVASLFGNPAIQVALDGVDVACEPDNEGISRLTYFARAANGRESVETTQRLLEQSARLGRNRQATRYSVHGLHEYKGKFNPQVARALLNIFGVKLNQSVLDPFCGSGTTLVECTHLGARGYGTDLNPFAVFLANAKLQALATPADLLRDVCSRLKDRLDRDPRQGGPVRDGARERYLRSWFEPAILQTLEDVRAAIESTAAALAPVFLALASDLLRAYSLQDPKDLRIRRRRSPLPDTPFVEAWLSRCSAVIQRIEATQDVLGTDLQPSRAVLQDVTRLAPANLPTQFDAAVTSPPYAMALPYIDTQRLSLVWLNLAPPERILGLEAELIGSREFRGGGRTESISALRTNDEDLPAAEASLCQELEQALGDGDGFRRRAVPALLYRYLTLMKRSFGAVRRLMRPGAPFGLIVGCNHSTLGGVRHDIDTPSHLASLASNEGWIVEELIPLQTYRRYGYHMNNAVRAETLLLLRNP